MTTRPAAPVGSPCWVDLWTSDVPGSRAFYGELFGWEAQEPSPEFGGYFMFTRHGVPVAGGMGDMGDMTADNRWKIYLATDDATKTVEAARGAGAEVVVPPVAVADLGVQAVVLDPAGAPIGTWQPGAFPGFTVLNEHGAPSWFELHSADFARSLDFYRSVFGLQPTVVADSDDFRYATVRDAGGRDDVAGIADAAATLADPTAGTWVLYWEVDDADAAADRVGQLGGSVVTGAEDTPYGRIAGVTDPAGAPFRLRQSPR